MIYLDHAATSWPKSPEVPQAMARFLEEAGGNPGRAGHSLSVEAGRRVYAAREAVAELFHVRNPLRVVFAANATQALNLALRGLLHAGDHVVTSSAEHNAVMRPLRALEREGVRLSIVPCAPDGLLDPAAVEQALTARTRLVVFAHASNVSGALQPVSEIVARARKHGVPVLLDAAQTAGAVPVDLAALGVDLCAFTGHKGLLGPPGTGGLVLGEHFDPAKLEPLIRGGTGSHSEEEEQPDELPDKFESGTPNGAGIAGLGAGVRWVRTRGVEALRAHELVLARRLRDGLTGIPGVWVYGPREPERTVAIVSFTVAGRRVSEIGLRLDEEYGILCRVGLHCAPAAHRTLGTFPEGTVRFAPGPLTTPEEINQALITLEHIVRT